MPRLRLLYHLWTLCLLGNGGMALAKIQFDVFPGYEGRLARAGAWYPVSFEIFNDGPSFDGVIEVGESGGNGQWLSLPVELPSQTRKILTTQLFCPNTLALSVDARLLDSAGKLRDERLGQRVDVVEWEGYLLGTLPGAFSGAPAFPQVGASADEKSAATARLEPAFFPDSPIPLEGLNALYLNTSAALKLREPQIEALLSWLHSGGHLIVAIDQPGDLNALGWLRSELPARVSEATQRKLGPQMQSWVAGNRGSAIPDLYGYCPPNRGARSDFNAQRQAYDSRLPVPQDPVFATNETPVYTLKVNLGVTSLSLGTNATALPLVVTQSRDHGQVTLLAFNPEREPFKSWKARSWFWTRVNGLTPSALNHNNVRNYGGHSLDGVFGALIETRQIRKLPIGSLLLLLVVYLLVIGPLDQWWLSKLNRPMWTWFTFPTYVVLFSLLIYVIGYKLRAGKVEWTEYHILDVIPQAAEGRAALRGRTFASLYSPRNDSYPIGINKAQTALRPENRGLWVAGNLESHKTTVTSKPSGTTAELRVDVWTSQLNVLEWQDYGDVPIAGQWETNGARLHLENLSAHRIEKLWVVTDGQILSLPGLAPRRGSDFSIQSTNLVSLSSFNEIYEKPIPAALSQRGQAFGGNETTHLDDLPETAITASFGRILRGAPEDGRGYFSPPGLDLTPLEERGDTLVFAWMPDVSFMERLPKFKTPRHRQFTLIRFSMPARPGLRIPRTPSP